MSLEHHLTDLLAMFSFAQNEILFTREREGPSGIELIFVRVPCVSSIIYVSCHDLAKRLSHYLYFFSFLFLFLWTYNYKVECGKVSCDFVTMSQWCDGWSQMVTRCHMTRVT